MRWRLGALLVAPVVALWILLAIAYADAWSGGFLALIDAEYGYCTGDWADPTELPVAVAGLVAYLVVLVRGRRGRAFALVSGVAFVVWIAIVWSGGCGIGSDDELGALVPHQASTAEGSRPG